MRWRGNVDLIDLWISEQVCSWPAVAWGDDDCEVRWFVLRAWATFLIQSAYGKILVHFSTFNSRLLLGFVVIRSDTGFTASHDQNTPPAGFLFLSRDSLLRWFSSRSSRCNSPENAGSVLQPPPSGLARNHPPAAFLSPHRGCTLSWKSLAHFIAPSVASLSVLLTLSYMILIPNMILLLPAILSSAQRNDLIDADCVYFYGNEKRNAEQWFVKYSL